jgi:hypothetical protein
MSKLNKLKLWYYIGTGICFLFICWLILFGEINRYSFFIIFIGWILIGYCRGYCKGRSDEMLVHTKAIESVLEEYLQNHKTEREEQTAQEIREDMHHVD